MSSLPPRCFCSTPRPALAGAETETAESLALRAAFTHATKCHKSVARERRLAGSPIGFGIGCSRDGEPDEWRKLLDEASSKAADAL